jgi:lysophospholipase L1-like esterase
VLYVGENDISTDSDVRTIKAKFERLVSHIRKSLSTTELVCISIKPSPHRINSTELVRQINTELKTYLSTLPNTKWIDIFNPFLDSNGQIRLDYFGRDRLHLNDKGYKVWDQALKAELV